MVILIGGIGCTGKTLMAQRLLEKYKIPYLSIDHLKMGLIKGDVNCRFTVTDSNEVIGQKLWPILKGIIMTNIENNQNIIIEGCYLLPHLVKDFEKEYLNNIITVFIGFSEKYINNNFADNIIRCRNVIEKRMYEEERPISQFINEHNELKKKCMETGVEYFWVDSDYDKEMQGVYDFIEDRRNKL